MEKVCVCDIWLFFSLPPFWKEEIFPSVHEEVKVAAECPFLCDSDSCTNEEIAFIGLILDLFEL